MPADKTSKPPDTWTRTQNWHGRSRCSATWMHVLGQCSRPVSRDYPLFSESQRWTLASLGEGSLVSARLAALATLVQPVRTVADPMRRAYGLVFGSPFEPTKKTAGFA